MNNESLGYNQKKNLKNNQFPAQKQPKLVFDRESNRNTCVSRCVIEYDDFGGEKNE